MGQEEVYQTLKQIGKPLSAKEIAEAINCSMKIVFDSLNRLLKYGEVSIIEIPRGKAMRLYHSKRRMRLYYVEEIK